MGWWSPLGLSLTNKVGAINSPQNTMIKFSMHWICLLVLCATVPNVAVNARRRVVSINSSNRRHRGDALKNPSFVDGKHLLISEEGAVGGVNDVRGGQGGGTATMSSEMFNMVKAVVGVGVLSLPAGKKVI